MASESEPMAIIGIGCRFPGGANDMSSSWELLTQGRNAWSEVPSTRFKEQSFLSLSRGTTAAYSHHGGHFLRDDVGAFDAAFFRTSRPEAEAMHPQQRMQLEVAYEALENAGISMEALTGSATGVYVAAYTHDYENLIFNDPITIPKYSMTGLAHAIIANRISHTFDLKGPSVALNTACSGSLVALHQACQSLRLQETSMALVGGTNLILSPDAMIPMDRLGLLNQHGRCFAFDERGSGYGRGEGVAMVVVKRLVDAIAAGDTIRAVIRSSVVGQDGHTRTITSPNVEAQMTLIRRAYQAAGLDPGETCYVEAHATGTVAGDPVEIEAIGRTLGAKKSNSTEGGRVLYVGSIKANIGHLESTSGLAGLIKVISILENGVVPPIPNLERIKTSLDLQKWGIERDDTAGRTPSVSTEVDEEPTKHGARLYVVSSASQKSLEQTTNNIREWALAHRDLPSCLPDLSYTLTQRRSLLPLRYAVVSKSLQELLSELSSKSQKPKQASRDHSVIWMFTGQGAQWPAMARELVRFAVFRNSLDTSGRMIEELGANWDLQEELARDKVTSHLSNSEYAQPANTAVQIALVVLLRQLNVQPSVVLRHSSGEIAAAYAAGSLSHHYAIRVSYFRGLLSQRSYQLNHSNGAMLAVNMCEKETQNYITMLGHPGNRLAIACVNSPRSTTVSGDADAIVKLQDLLADRTLPSRYLDVDTAYHSHHMRAVADVYLRELGDIPPGKAQSGIKFFSSVTASEKVTDFGSPYWVSNLVSTVRFSDALGAIYQHLISEGSETISCTFMEVGPHNTLTKFVDQTVRKLRSELAPNCDVSLDTVATLKRENDAHVTFLESIGLLLEHGCSLNLQALDGLCHSPRPSLITDLPPYSWDHTDSYWHGSRSTREHLTRTQPYHDLLGLRQTAVFEPIWRQILSIDKLPWLRDIATKGLIVFPAPGYIAMVTEAKRQITLERSPGCSILEFHLRDIVFSNTLEIPNTPDNVEVQTHLGHDNTTAHQSSTSWENFRISALSASGVVTEHCRGQICVVLNNSPLGEDPMKDITESLRDLQDAENKRLSELKDHAYTKYPFKGLYHTLESVGNSRRPASALVDGFESGDNGSIGRIRPPDSRKPSFDSRRPDIVHPITLEALLDTARMHVARAGEQDISLPVQIGEIIVSAEGSSISSGSLTSTVTSAHSPGLLSVVDVAAFQADDNSQHRLRVLFKNTEFLRTGSHGVQTIRQPDQWNSSHKIKWVMDVDHDPYLSKGLQSSLETLEACKRQETKLLSLNRAVRAYASDCINQLRAGDVKLRYSEYYAWLMSLMAERPISSTSDQSRTIESLIGPTSVESAILLRIGTNLASILTGHTEPLSLLFKDDLLSRFYAEDVASCRCYNQMAKYVGLLASRKRLKILEIGAGTGGATLPTLKSLDASKNHWLDHYDFTDVSSGFFDRARQKLERWEEFLRFKILDIDKDPLEQGFEEEGYDLVLASNALHTAYNLDIAISHVRKLLATGGRLILIECTQLPDFVNAFTGLLSGWLVARRERYTIQELLQEEALPARMRTAQTSRLRHEVKITLILGERSTISISGPNDKMQSRLGKETRVLWISNIQSLAKYQAQSLRVLDNQPNVDNHSSNEVRIFVDDKSTSKVVARQIHQILVESHLVVEKQKSFESHYLIRDGAVLVPRLYPYSRSVTAETMCEEWTKCRSSQAVEEAHSGPQLISDKKNILYGVGTFLVISDFEAENDGLCSFLTERGVREILVLTKGVTRRKYQWKTKCVRILYQVFTSNSELGEMLLTNVASMSSVNGVIFACRHCKSPAHEPDVRDRTLANSFSQIVWSAVDASKIRFCARLSIFDDPWQALKQAVMIDIWDDGTTRTMDRIYSTLEWAMKSKTQKPVYQAYLVGFEAEQLRRTEMGMMMPIMSIIPSKQQGGPSVTAAAVKPQKETIEKSQSVEEALQIVTLAIKSKISTYVAIQSDQIENHVAIEDCGLDSLMWFEFRQWVERDFHAFLTEQEFSGSGNISDLAAKITSRTDLLGHLNKTSSYPEIINSQPGLIVSDSPLPEEVIKGIDSYPTQPLMPLDEIMRQFIATANTFCTDAEMKSIRSLIAKFEKVDGLGPMLHNRLASLSQSTNVANYISHRYAECRYLRLRTPLVNGQIFFGTHALGSQPLTQAQRAALITLAVFDFKRNLESAQVTQQIVGGQAVDLGFQRWLFNTCREPHPDEDRVIRHSVQEEYLVVRRYGQSFKIPLQSANCSISFDSLKLVYQKILDDTAKNEEDIGLLTADHRDTWAQHKANLLEFNAVNKDSIKTIEASTFVVCLDDASPHDAIQRCNQFLFANESNRWYDKSLQFIICANGASATLFEHSYLDGITIGPLNYAINEAIESYTSRSPLANSAPIVAIERLPLLAPQITQDHLVSLRKSLDTTFSKFTFASLHTSTLGASILRKAKCPPQSGVQIAINLGLRRFFNITIPACETVSLAHFRQGRVEVHHTIQPAVALFLSDAVGCERTTFSSSPTLRASFYEAARAHAKSFARCRAGKGFSRHMLAMEWMLDDVRKELIEYPQDAMLFEDEVYRRMKPGRIMTSCATSGWLEGGFVYPVPEGVFVYFEIQDEAIRFSIFGNEVDAERVKDELVKGLDDVKALLIEHAE
ncbi:MAG: hypothetical protein Q9204_001674 [Flavoplaca sp. TL-2023a]